MIYLDTHVVVWLYAGLSQAFSQKARSLINEHDLRMSPIVQLEMQYLYEIGRLQVDGAVITSDLTQRLGLQICDLPFEEVVSRALSLAWTRDPFDRLIVAQAQAREALLLTKDQTILDHYAQAVW